MKRAKTVTTGSTNLDAFIDDICDLGNLLLCPICRSLFYKCAVALPCFHALCEGCCKNLLGSKTTAKCPTCRQDFREAQVKPDRMLQTNAECFITLRKRDSVTVLPSSQVGSFSQIAKEMFQVVIENHGSKDTPVLSTIGQAHPKSMPTAMETNISSAESRVPPNALTGLNTASGGERRSLPKVPKFDLDVPVSVTKSGRSSGGDSVIRNVDVTPSLGERLLRMSSSSRSNDNQPSDHFPIASETPNKETERLLTPPTVKLETVQTITDSRLQGLAFTPSTTVLIKTPPTIKLDNDVTTVSSTSITDSSNKAGLRKKSMEKTQGDEIVVVATMEVFTVDGRSVILKKGSTVTVARRMGKGQNKPGGVAKVLKVYTNRSVDVSYTVEAGREMRIPLDIVKFGIQPLFTVEEIGDESLPCTGRKNEFRANQTHHSSIQQDIVIPVSHAAATIGAEVCQKQMPRCHDDAENLTNNNLCKTNDSSHNSDIHVNELEQSKATVRQLTFTSTGNSPPCKANEERRVVIVFVDGDGGSLKNAVEHLGGMVFDKPEDSDWSGLITHVVALDVNERSKGVMVASTRTISLLRAISRGLWVMSSAWILESVRTGCWVDESPYELAGDLVSRLANLNDLGPRMAREAIARFDKTKQHEGLLLYRYHIALVGAFDEDSSDLIALVKASKGKVFGNAVVEWSDFDVEKFIRAKPSKDYKQIVIGQASPKQKKSATNAVLSKMNKHGYVPVTIKWLFDSIASYKAQSLKDYQMG